MKKFMAIMLALVLALGMTSTAFAESITIDPQLPEGTSDGQETYNAYLIFDATYVGTDPENQNVAYTIDESDAFYAFIKDYKQDVVVMFTLTSVVGSNGKYVVEPTDAYTSAAAETLAVDLKAYIEEEEIEATKSVSAANDEGKYVIEDLEKGYYLVTSTLGSKMIVDTTSSVTINTKNTYPTIEKKIATVITENEETSVQTFTTIADAHTVDHGEAVTFVIKVSIPETASGAITVHDALDSDYTYVDNSLSTAIVNGVEDDAAIPANYTNAENESVVGVTKSSNKACTETDCNHEFVLSADCVAGNLGNTVYFTYQATLNTSAATQTNHPNKVWLTYSTFKSTEDTVNVQTYKFNVYKYTNETTTTTDETTGETTTTTVESGLAGAGFILKDENNRYYNRDEQGIVTWVDIADATEYITSADNEYTVTFLGLEAGTYTLIERTVPTGYNPASDQTVTISNVDLVNDSQIKVLNSTGSELPSTGGMGTTIFYVVGGMMMAAAFVLLITKRKVASEK